MQPVATDVPWSFSLSICLLDTTVRCAKMAEQIKKPFGLWTLVVDSVQLSRTKF